MSRGVSLVRATSGPGSNAVAPIRSRKVRKVLKLEARAERWRARYERTLACATPLLERAEALRREIRATELSLTGTELGELRRARNAAARGSTR
jgi:hypothetical protein